MLICMEVISFEPTTHSLEGCCSIQLSYGAFFWPAKLEKFKLLTRFPVITENSNFVTTYNHKEDRDT